MMLSCATAVEQGNPELQDKLVVLPIGMNSFAFCLADGAGGTPGGTEAAEMAVRLFQSLVDERQIHHARVETDFWLGIANEIDHAIYDDASAGECTLIVGLAYPSDSAIYIIGASIGDSEAVIIRPSSVLDLTEHQVRKPLAGSGEASPVSFIGTSENGEPSILVVGSDGLFKYSTIEKIAKIARGNAPVSDLPPRFIDSARMKNGGLQDDIAVLAIRVSHLEMRCGSG